MKKAFLFTTLLFLFANIILAQEIEFTNKIEVDFKPEENAAYFDGGFVNMSTFHLQVFDEKTNTMITKEWSNIRNSPMSKIPMFSGSFSPNFCNVIDSKINVLVHDVKNNLHQILMLTFDMQLNLVDEKLVTETPIIDPGLKAGKSLNYYARSFHKSPKTGYYIFAQGCEFKDENENDQLDYVIYDNTFKEIEHTNIKMPVRGKRFYERMDNIVESIITLEDGTPIINFDGMLYILGPEGALKMEMELEHEIKSYRIIKKNDKEIILVGTYVEGELNEKSSGIAIITFDYGTLELKNQTYTQVDEKFDVLSDNLYKAMVSGGSPVIKKNDGIPLIMDAQVDKNGTIRIVIFGFSMFSNDYGIMNIDVLGLKSNGEILFEKVIPKKYQNFQTSSNYGVVFFLEKQTLIFADDYKTNFDEQGNFKPNKETKYLYGSGIPNGKLIKHFITYDQESNESTIKVINFKASNEEGVEYDNKLMVVDVFKCTNPDDKYYIISNYKPHGSKYGSFGNGHTLIGKLNVY